MKCNLCSGDGIVRNVTAALSGNDACPRCHGSGLEPQGHDRQFDKNYFTPTVVAAIDRVSTRIMDASLLEADLYELVTVAVNEAPSATLPKFFIWTGGECPQEWLCKDIPEVQAALCEALYGRAEDADADEIGKYLAQVQEMTGRDLEYEYEDGWLQIIKLHLKQQYVK